MTDLTTLPPQPGEPAPDFLSRPLVAALNIDWEKAIYLTFMIIAVVTRFYGLGDRVVSHDESLGSRFDRVERLEDIAVAERGVAA